MRYAERPPTPLLAPWVECLWAMEGAAPAPDAPDDPVLPDGCMEIVLHLGAPVVRGGPGAREGGSQHAAAVVGQIERALHLAPAGAVRMVGARLKPEGASALLGFAVGALTGTSAPLDTLDRPGSPGLLARAEEAPDLASAVRALESGLLGFGARPPSPLLVEAVRRARAARGALAVADLARAVGVSPRHLERRFRAEVGLSPKRLLRILRVRRAAQRLRAGARPVDAALDAGYFDESHLHRDFRDVVGCPPGRWARTPHPLADPFLG